MIADQEVRDLIQTELERNLMVDASAGSGKTQSLALRMAEGLMTGVYQSQALAAVTFTRKAASELRGRLQQVLEEALRKESDSARRARATEALADLEQMFIGTIHSLCSRILREYPVEAGISPGFRELDDLTRRQLLSRVYRRVFQESSHRFSDSVRALNQGELARNSLAQALDLLCQNQEVEFLAEEVEAPDLRQSWNDLDLFAAEMKVRLPATLDPAATCLLQKNCFHLLRQLSQADRSKMAVLLGVLKRWTKSLKVTQKNWPGECSRERKAAALSALELAETFVEEAVRPFFRRWQAYLYWHALKILKETRAAFQSERHSLARLDYSDLLLEAAKLLRTNLEVRRALASRFQWLLVDEFQDTDPLQAEVVVLLAAEPSGQEKSWSEMALRPGALFVVGDPKQSIYRFRRADIRTYEQVKQVIVNSGGSALRLTASFRSLPSICEFVNAAFGRLFPNEASEIQAPFAPLQPVRSAPTDAFAGVYTLTDYSPKNQFNRVSQNEARRVARLIHSQVSEGRYQWRDFLLLTTKRRQVLTYSAALEELSVPVEAGGGYPEDSRWVKVMKSLLRVLSDAQDAVQTVGVLRGALFGLSDQDLFLHRQSGGAFHFGVVQADSPGHPSVLAALLKLRDLRRLSRALPAGAGIERILEESGVLSLAACEDPADGEVPALLQLADQMRGATIEGRSLAQALRELELVAQDRPVSVNAGRSNVVRVMNLHQAKGLQSTVVFLVAPTDGARVRCDIRISRHPDSAMGALAIRSEKPYGGQGELLAAPEDWEFQEQEELEALEAERVRLLYVAATRARDVLVVSRWADEHGLVVPAWEGLLPDLTDTPELPWAILEEPDAEVSLTLDDANQAALEREIRWAACREPSWQRRSVSGRNSEEKIEFQPIALPSELIGGERLDVGPAWGDLIHRLLEQAARKPDIEAAELERYARWFIFDEPDLETVISLAVETVMDVRQTEFWQKILQGEQRLTEVPFGVKSDNGKMLLFGVLDLVSQQDGSWQILDYKSDITPMEHLVRKYAGQIVPYAKHWAEITGEEVDYAGLLRVRSGELSDDLSGN